MPENCEVKIRIISGFSQETVSGRNEERGIKYSVLRETTACWGSWLSRELGEQSTRTRIHTPRHIFRSQAQGYTSL